MRERPEGSEHVDPQEPAVGFAGFRFHMASGELFEHDRRVALGPTPTAILAVLLEHAGRLVERERLYEAAWPAAVVEFDQGLNACVRQIRRALGDDARSPRFIETIPRRGYRFAHAVERTEAQRDKAPAPRTRRPWRAAAALIVVLGVAGGGWLAARAPMPSVLAHVDFDVVSERPELVDLGREMERQVRTQVRRLVPSGGAGGVAEPFYITGTLTEQDDGALLRALLVRARDGRIVWSGSFNPLCERAASDPKPFIGAYLARVLARS